MRFVEGALLLFLLLLSGGALARPGPGDPNAHAHATDLIPLTENLSIKLFPFPHLTRARVSQKHVSDTSGHNKRRVGFFTDNPLVSVKRSFQDIQSNMERSMQTLIAAGSAIGHKMLGMMTRAPRLLIPAASSSVDSPAPAGQHHHPAAAGSDSVSPAQFQPYNDIVQVVNNEINNDIESYGAPTADVVSYPAPAPAPQPIPVAPADIESYGAPAAPVLESYGSPVAPVGPSYTPLAPAPAPAYQPESSPFVTIISDGPTVDLTNDVFDNTIEIDGEPIIEQEPVIHPGGSQSVDYNKVSHIGVHTVVQAASAQVPDQSHPEKYLNHNHDHLVDVVEHNLWRKEIKKFKHFHHGEKPRVIPHLAPTNA